jgi:hypothetical protein
MEDVAPFSRRDSPLSNSATYVQQIVTAPASQDTMRALFSINTTGDVDVLLDDATLNEIEGQTVFRLQRVYYPSTVEVALRNTQGTQGGVVLFNSLTNYIVALDNGTGKANLLAVSDGVATHRAAGNITYVAGQKIKLIPNAAFDTFAVNYNDVEVIAATAIPDFWGLSGSWYAGILKTYNSEDIDTDAFDDFSAVRVAGAPPF